MQSVLFHYISFKTLRAFQSGKWSSHRPNLFCLFISDEEEESFIILAPEVTNGRLHRPLSDDVGLGLNQTLKNESFIITWRMTFVRDYGCQNNDNSIMTLSTMTLRMTQIDIMLSVAYMPSLLYQP
jgi:hypothetical protein